MKAQRVGALGPRGATRTDAMPSAPSGLWGPRTTRKHLRMRRRPQGRHPVLGGATLQTQA
eukprot:1683096-Pyramimonas_sp.AAC.1